MNDTFNNIYSNNIWNNNNNKIPLSGPGSSLDNTKELVSYLNNLKGFNSCLDIGCGDLTWISKTSLFNENYIGIDVSDYIIGKNKKTFNNMKFYTINAVNGKLFDAELFICRDVMFHLNREDNIQLLKNIGNYNFKYIILTSSNCNNNIFDINNSDHFCPINLEIRPFNFKNITYRIDEKHFNRKIMVLSYDSYIDNIKNIK